MTNTSTSESLPRLTCLIVEDDATSRLVLEHYIRLTPGLELVGSLPSGVAGLEFFQAGRRADVLFLDLAMPELDGLELLRQLADPPAVIITTALASFAQTAAALQVADYLIKPIRLVRFYEAVQRLRPWAAVGENALLGALMVSRRAPLSPEVLPA